ncbi:MAG: hypothetical protein A3B65_01025 [Acidobacteria bacterium RIFCSPHIGHO2_02_FULL_67_57]|nr:MAG: hypothetical protein A3B65_01025 [Acidobacteria bacterium RIFCSPHIGHO2_02_FULL_67_57]OFV84706.1 MAG: hypothetical protein A2620_02225 [Acidobacteria bacterium RIFCSPHIGHO2_01_FULL_67_28]
MRCLLLLLLAGLLVPPGAVAQDIDWKTYEDMAVARLARYLQLNTTNPPGNELTAARFFEEWFMAEGIPVEVYEFAPGRANLVARLKGDGSKRPLILLNHMDVVSSDPARWREGPFSGAVVAGDLYGRGALDMKGLGLTQAMVLVMLKREGVPLRRDVLFVATSDEEVAMKGAEWLVDNQRDLLAAAEYLLTEGGSNLVENGRLRYLGVDNAEKVPFWLRLRARGAPGHGSRPMTDAPPHRLVRALARVVDWETPLQVLPGVEKFFRDVADQEPPARAEKFRRLRESLADPEFRGSLTRDPVMNFMLRNTVSLTVLRGSPQTNVIPGEAVGELDVRLLPGEDPQEFLRQLRAVLADDTIEIEPIQEPFRQAIASPIDTELFRAIETVAGKHFPGVPVTTRMLSGYTESGLFRRLGIICYGFEPFFLTREEQASVHGDNERVSLENVRRGLRVYYEVVERMVR